MSFRTKAKHEDNLRTIAQDAAFETAPPDQDHQSSKDALNDHLARNSAEVSP